MAGRSNGVQYTVTSLNRWSVANKQLPSIEKIKTIHVYDFDNTLFNSPLPNPKLWNGPTVGFLQQQEGIINGGWWHDARILGATGEGVEKEEPRAWEGWWNERIVELIRLSIEQKDALAVLLTGRAEPAFAELIKKMVASKGLEFDMVCLKPPRGPNQESFSSTMVFKQCFLEFLVETYKTAEEIRIYEDRPRHVKAFREYFTDYNRRQNGMGGSPTRGPIVAEVVQVADNSTQLDPVLETAEVQRLLNDHNTQVTKARRGTRLQIKKTVFYTGYLISKIDTQKLLTLAQLPPNMPDTEMKFLANNILITPRPAPPSILEKVGGMGSKTTWEVTGTAVFESKIWAASVKPVPETTKYYTENPSPIVVLALRKGARPIDAGKIQNWQPVPEEKQFVFESEVGEKILLRIEEENSENDYESLFPNKALKRKHEDDEISRSSGSYGGNNNNNGRHNQNYNQSYNQNQKENYNNSNIRGNRGGRGNRGNGGGGRGRGNNGRGGRGRGGHGYRSLDDVDRNHSGTPPSYNSAVAYEDFPPLQKQYQTPQQLVQQQFQQYQNYQQSMQGKGNKGGGGGGVGELQYS